MSVEIDFTPDQAMSPCGLNIEMMAQKADLAVVVGTANVNDASTVQGRSVVPAPLSRKVHAYWGGLDASG
jgi:hypothetical protein